MMPAMVLAWIFSFFSVFRLLLPAKIDLPEIIFRLPIFKNLSADSRKFAEGVISGVIATIIWSLYYHNYRIEPNLPSGFITLSGSIIGGPVMAIAWSSWGLKRLHRQKPLSLRSWLFWKRESVAILLYRYGLVAVIMLSLAGSGFGYYAGLKRPLENGVVVAGIRGLDPQYFDDALRINLEHLQDVTGSAPRAYPNEVSDIVAAHKAASDTNQRFVVWGSINIEERSEDVLATVLIRITDASEKIETFSSEEYELKAASKTEITKRVANDLTLFSVLALGWAEATWQPTHESAVQASRILALLSSEKIHKNVLETKKLGLLLQDFGYEVLYHRLDENGYSVEEMARVFSEAIAMVEASGYRGSESALARLHNYYAAAFINHGFHSLDRTYNLTTHLTKAVELDPTYAIPHHHLAWLRLASGDSGENAIYHTCEFLHKFKEAYGELLTEHDNPFQTYVDNVHKWLEQLEVDCDNETLKV